MDYLLQIYEMQLLDLQKLKTKNKSQHIDIKITNVSIVLSSLKKVAPDTYQAEFNEFLDDKLQGSSIMQYKFALEDGEWKIDNYRQISPN